MSLEERNEPFLNSVKKAFLLGFAAGLYPLIFYYSRNFGMANSGVQLGYFSFLFLGIPILIFFVGALVLRRLPKLSLTKFVLPFTSVFTFSFFLHLVLYSEVQKKITLLLLVISAVLAVVLWRHQKKIVGLQLLMAAIGCIGLFPVLVKYFGYSDAWTKQSDTIEEVVFKKYPNVYLIQPDGYSSSKMLANHHYNFDNSTFQDGLKADGFQEYPNFRSNYFSTLTSNSAAFMMKHHYYLDSKDNSEMLRARENIVGENPVLSIFKNNGYQTFFLTEHPYLLINRPTLGYDYSNFEYSEIPFMTTGFERQKDVISDLEATVMEAEGPKFAFIQIFEPGHIPNTEAASEGRDTERENWLEKLEVANKKLDQIRSIILENDPDALVIIMADHGGFVGLDFTRQVYTKITDNDLIYSIFGSMLAIRWPDKNDISKVPINSSVNVFRTVFSYLSEENRYLEATERDESYLIIKEGATPGIYQLIDHNGNVVFNPINTKNK